MTNPKSRTAVGAGTTAGDAADEEHARESRAAEAEQDDQLESLRTTGAQPVGAPTPAAGRPPAGTESGSASTAAPEAPAPAHPNLTALHPERARTDLRQNQAGVASRLEHDPGVRGGTAKAPDGS